MAAELNKVSPGAFKYTSQVNQALLGENPHDLSGLISNLDRVVRGLDGNEEAARRTWSPTCASRPALRRRGRRRSSRRSSSCRDTLDAGNAAFANLNAAFPPLRAFAREALPGVRTAPATLDAATPLLRQLAASPSRRSCAGLVADLRPTVPDLAKLTKKTIPFLEQARALSSCFNHAIIPWAERRGRRRRRLQRRAGPTARSSRRPATGSPGSPARAAPATPTASTSA